MLALVITLAVAQQTPNPPPIDRPAEEPRELMPPTVDDSEPDFEPLPKPVEPRVDEKKPSPPTPKSLPPPDERGPVGEPLWFSLIGCAGLGCPPATGAAIGGVTLLALLALPSTGPTGACLAIVGVVGGLVIGAPSAVALGPCASGGALLGAILGAIAGDRDLGPLLLASIPGLAMGLLAAGGAIWGLAVLANTSGDYVLPVSILVASTLTGLAAGPATIVGVGIADAAAPPTRRPARETEDQLEPEPERQIVDAIETAMRY